MRFFVEKLRLLDVCVLFIQKSFKTIFFELDIQIYLIKLLTFEL